MRFALVLLIGSALSAHDLYLKPTAFRLSPGQLGTVEFHSGDSFPNSESPPVLSRVRDARLTSSHGEQNIGQLRVQGKMAVGEFTTPAASGALLTARTIPNFIELDPVKFEQYLEHENLHWVIDWRKGHGESRKPGRELYSKYVKSILHTGGPDSFVCRPSGQTIEFVPFVDPASLKPGQTLQVRILFRGSPARDLHVEASSLSGGAVKQRDLGRTDSKGQISIPLDVAGIWKLHAIRMECSNSNEADWESFWASLTFEVTP